jgi:DNA-binding MarR family transcriptional regulator
MYRFVDANSRRGDLAEALGFRLGAGRGKVLFLLRHGPMTLGKLAEAIGADAPYTTLIVDKLEAHGLVERLPHPADRRRKLVTLTTAGEEAIAIADAILLRPPPAFSSLPAQDLEQLTQILTRLVGADEPRVDAQRSPLSSAHGSGPVPAAKELRPAGRQPDESARARQGD